MRNRKAPRQPGAFLQLSPAISWAMLAPVVRFLLVCLGGAVGTGARYLFGGWTQRLLGAAFPYGTLGVNLVGSFLIIVVVQLSLAPGKALISPDLRLILSAGVMGGFTTYSSFNYDTVQFLRNGAPGLAFLNMAVTLLGCLAAAGLGLLVARWFT